MADGVTSTGLEALRQAIDRFPEEVTLRLRAVAWRKSREVQTRAKQFLRAQVKGRGKDRLRTVDAIVVNEKPDEKLFEVTVENPENPNLGLWLERGTRYMAARPFMRPANDAVTPSYKREMQAAAEGAAVTLEIP